MNYYVHNMLMTPWPKVERQKPDRHLVRQLFSMYGGQLGELTASQQYAYNSLVTAHRGEREASELFACIASNEQVHQRELGRLILLYGGDPRLLSFPGGRAAWWNGRTLRYAQATGVMLRQAISAERMTAQEYEKLAKQLPPQPRALIERIRQDELHHLELFERILREQYQ